MFQCNVLCSCFSNCGQHITSEQDAITSTAKAKGAAFLIPSKNRKQLKPKDLNKPQSLKLSSYKNDETSRSIYLISSFSRRRSTKQQERKHRRVQHKSKRGKGRSLSPLSSSFTQGPSFQVCPAGTQFTSIKQSKASGTLLNETATGTKEGEEVALPFQFNWPGNPTSSVWVSTKGFIRRNEHKGSKAGFFRPIGDSWANNNRIAVVQGTNHGEVYYSESGSGDSQHVIISWEGNNFESASEDEDADTDYVNAQVILYPNGNFNLCYEQTGLETLPGGNGRIVAGIDDYDTDLAIPAKTFGKFDAEGMQSIFDDEGITYTWPDGKCACFFAEENLSFGGSP